MNKKKFTSLLKEFNFDELFNELGWDNFNNKLPIAVNDDAIELNGIAEKRGFVILACPPLSNGTIPSSNSRKQIEFKVAKNYYEHLIIFYDADKKQQIWQLTIKEENKPKQVREVSWFTHQDVEVLFQRLKNLLFTLDEEEKITIIDVKNRISENFAKNTDQITKKFYADFKKQHGAFLDFITGIDDHIANKENENKQWYASLMLNRLMFCYFIQKKGFLNQDVHYLQNKLKECEKLDGKTNFYSFYRSFLLELFHDGLGKPITKRKEKIAIDLGKIPYLNGGLFDVHELERQFDQIHVEDDAFKKIFSFFDQWNWHLDNSVEATGKDINPDVIGYIFEKYINDRAAMGAYYTKEDITDYIGKNTIIPFLFDETERHYKDPFKENGALWLFLKESSDDYIYDAVKHGISDTQKLYTDLPSEVQAGINHPLENELVTETTSPHLWEIRQAWNQKVPSEIGLPTEIYRELIERRKRYATIKSKIENGEIESINDFITFNLNIRQFAQDFIENTSDASFIQHFYKAISSITILDPTCGSGAFLFASLNILEPLYEACIIRMEQFVSEQPGKHKYFEEVLAEVNDDKHPSLQYFIFKSIILNNLYGVDIMHEAVEIAKLRLFLKLVATVELSPAKENFGLEPLPDIDFNIRAGNTLIGFATENELLTTIQKNEPLFAADKLEEFKEEFELVSKAFSHFQNSQLINDQGSDSFKKAKAELIGKLKELNQNLNVYLATNYGIDATAKPKEFQSWLKSHQPFHWFAEFYNIIAINGGFDCIVGNPPYVEHNSNTFSYSLNHLLSSNCGNLYGNCIERSLKISQIHGKFSFIIPVAITCSKRMETVIALMKNNSDNIWFSNYDDRPGKLFEMIEHLRASIFILSKSTIDNFQSKIHSTDYTRWYTENRSSLFSLVTYSEITPLVKSYIIPKLSFLSEFHIYNKINKIKLNIAQVSLKAGNDLVYFRAAGGGYFLLIKTQKSVTYINDKLEEVKAEKHIILSKNTKKTNIGALLSSTLFYWFYVTQTDCRNLSKVFIDNFPITDEISNDLLLQSIGSSLFLNYENNKKTKNTFYKTTGNSVIYDEYYPKKSKKIINQIDERIAEFYGFTEFELDFIINYDIKYRMGKALYGEADEDEMDED